MAKYSIAFLSAEVDEMARTVTFRAEVVDDVDNRVRLQAVAVLNEPPAGSIEITPSEIPVGTKAVVRIPTSDPEGRPVRIENVTVSEGTIAATPTPGVYEYTAPAQ